MKSASVDAPKTEAVSADLLGRLMLLVFAAGLVAAIALAGRTSPSAPPAPLVVKARQTAAPPPVEPVLLKAVAPTDAVAINQAVPFAAGPNPSAKPFFLASTDTSYARSVDCLAATGLYEAGASDADGQRAVLQVVLNRLRHPAFPKTICGVVFQGSERVTGCQFTFTCDGAMRRTPSPAAWERAREIARQMIGGRVYGAVGHSTHYHTNWVVPYWSSSLDKVAQVGTHLFFRWTGWWGTPGAFRNRYSGGEAAIGKMAGLSEAHRGGLTPDEAQLATLSNVPPEAVANPGLLARFDERIVQDGDSFIIPMGRKVSADKLAGMALAACGSRDYCKVMAWADVSQSPRAFPINPALLSAMSFSYLRDRKVGYEKALWNCSDYDRPDKRDCMKARAVRVTLAPRSGKERVDMEALRASVARPAATRETGNPQPAKPQKQGPLPASVEN